MSLRAPGRSSSGLLRGNIMNGAKCLLRHSLRGIRKAGNAEIGDLYTPVPQDHDVLRLDIPVNNAPAVGVTETAHDLRNEMQRLTPVQLAPLFHILLQRDAIDEFHHDVFGIAAPGHTYTDTILG